jgi:translocator protein
MKQVILRQWLNVLAVVATIAVNGLANALPINGVSTGEISDSFSTYFTPAGYVFAIWGLIYLGLIGFGFYQVLPAQRDNPRLRQIDGLFLLSSAANIGWIPLWHYRQFAWTLAVMLVLLACLIGIYLRLGIGRTPVSRGEKWLVHVPFSIYLGWITVATIANVTVVLLDLGWNGGAVSPQIWSVVVLVAAGIIAGLVILNRQDAAFTGVVIWALAGIVVKYLDAPLVAGTAALVAVLVAALLVARLVRGGPSNGGLRQSLA